MGFTRRNNDNCRYSGGETENPTYEDVCYKNTNHVEVVKITYDEEITSLKKF